MSIAPSSLPVDQRRFEDYQPGAVYDCGTVAVDEAEILSFAKRFDPQPFHTDPEAARQSIFGGLIASGWHTTALSMRPLVEHYLSPSASLSSPGIDELRWLKPVRPGDVLSVNATVLKADRSKSKPDRGVVYTLVEVGNQRGETVMTFKALNLLRCRSTVPAPA
jgi:acyl dehydratase